jgi:hypothetical protein
MYIAINRNQRSKVNRKINHVVVYILEGHQNHQHKCYNMPTANTFSPFFSEHAREPYGNKATLTSFNSETANARMTGKVLINRALLAL